MSVFLSPGIFVKEKDISDIVARVATASAALVGYSAKGSKDDIVLVTNDQQFIEEYGKPDPSTGHYFHYAALAYLKKGNTLYCLRIENGAKYGGINVMKLDSEENNAVISEGAETSGFSVPSPLLDDVLFQVFGANPGVWNNKIRVKISDVKDGTDPVPTDQYTFKILVYYQDDDGNWPEVESWKVSRKNKIDGYGKDLYLEDKINGISKYIVIADSALEDTVVPKEMVSDTGLDLACGIDGSYDDLTSELELGWAEFENPVDTDVRILINGGETNVGVQTVMRDVAENRADCIAILDMPWNSVDSISDMTTFRGTTQNFNSNYCALYSPWVRIHDSYNDKLIYVPPSGYVAAQVAYNDYVANPWDAPAGVNRGVLDDVLQISRVFTEGERDTLYQVQINPLQTFRGEGHVIWGQKTEQKKSSALSSVNVRRLLIVIEKSMSISLKSFVFEPNSEITRFRVEALLDSYLDRLSAQGAFQTEAGDKGYHIVCDESNNPPVVIDNNELHVDVFVKPIRAAEYIQLQTIVTTSGASFEELVARGVMF